MNHIEYEWSNPVWGPFLNEFARQNRLVRFDQRANGLSEPEPERIEHDAMVEDMEAAADAAGLERCALFGMSQGASVTVRYLALGSAILMLLAISAFLHSRRAARRC